MCAKNTVSVLLEMTYLIFVNISASEQHVKCGVESNFPLNNRC